MPSRRMVAAVVASLAGCTHAGRPPAAPSAALPAITATPEELARRIDADADAVASVQGKLDVAFADREGARPRSCSAVLAARSPRAGPRQAGLYLKGYRALVPTLFTLVSDGRSFWLHVPRDNVVYTGPIARRGAPDVHGVRLEARDLFRALFLEPLGGEAVEVDEGPEAYVVSARREGRLERRLWVERRRLTVAREVFYDREGREELSIDRDRWVDAAGRLYPERLRVRDAATGASATLEFERLVVNPPDLRAEAFRPRTPAGARVVTVAGEDAG